MRKKLLSLGFALAALAAASAFAPASAATKSCPSGTYEFTCGNFTVCCHVGALCHC
jgi:hypothetical protein